MRTSAIKLIVIHPKPVYLLNNCIGLQGDYEHIPYECTGVQYDCVQVQYEIARVLNHFALVQYDSVPVQHDIARVQNYFAEIQDDYVLV